MKRKKVIEEILDNIGVIYVENEESTEEFSKYMCYIEIDEDLSFPFLVVIDYSSKFIIIGTLPIMKVSKEKEKELFKIINKFNSNLVYGTFYVENGNLIYNVGISIENSEDDISINPNQIEDYIDYMQSSTGDIIEAIQRKLNY